MSKTKSKKGQPLFRNMAYCVRCCIPETEEGHQRDELGICRACRSSEQKMHIDWHSRENDLRRILEASRAKAGNNYDCLLPISGGKDSMFQAHVLVNVYNMKPLAVTFNHNWYSETGWYNLMNLLETFKIDHIMFTPNRDLVNRMAKRSLHTIGDTCWHCHSGCGAFPLQVAVKFKIPLIVYGESVAESQGRASYYEPIKFDREYFTKVSAKKTPNQMVCDYITPKDVHPFQLPTEQECEEAGVMGIHLGTYIFWDGERQTEFVRDEYGWRETEIENSYKRYKSAECVMPGMHDFTCYLKRGFGRATDQACIDVRNGLLTREEGLRLISQIDPIRPEALDYFLGIANMNEDEFYKAMESQRMPQLKGVDMPVLPKEKSNEERILPFTLQLIERLKSKEIPHYDTGRQISREMKERHDLSANIFTQWSIKQILEGYLNKAVTPVDIAEACISRIQEVDPHIQAFQAFNPELLLEGAHEIEKRLASEKSMRLLEGIPVGIKDIFNTKDFLTEMGSPIWKGFNPGNDARVVFHIKRAGGLLAGKTVTAEFAVHALGKTLNPHDLSRNPGTSSSGSAVAVATGMVPVALGSQTAGSIIRPASYCGVYGFKPSFGLIPRTGTLKTTDSLDTLGFFTAYFEDLETVFNVLRVHGRDYPISNTILTNKQRQNKPDNRPWRVALFPNSAWEFIHPYAEEAFLSWINTLMRDKNIEIVGVKLPKPMKRCHEIHAMIYDSTLAYYFKDEAKRKELVSPIMYELIEHGRSITKEQYQQALNDQEELIIIMDELMSDFDAGLCLSTVGEAPLREEREKRDQALMWTLTHLPAISAPVFVSPGGLPFGAQLFARKYNDLLLLKFAAYLRSRAYIPEKMHPQAQL